MGPGRDCTGQKQANRAQPTEHLQQHHNNYTYMMLGHEYEINTGYTKATEYILVVFQVIQLYWGPLCNIQIAFKFKEYLTVKFC